MQSDHGPQTATPPARSLALAAIQTELRFYASGAQFRDHLAPLVRRAAAHAVDLIVLPEDVGTGLLTLGVAEPRPTFASMAQAMAAVRDTPDQRARALIAEGVPAITALMLAQAPAVREVYVGTFSALARETGRHIAAGTVLLPHGGGRPHAVYNTAFLFGPGGEIVATADKVNLIPLESEGLLLTPGAREALVPWHTPLGALGPVICADAWDAELVAGLVEQGAELLLCPSANPEPWTEAMRQDRLQGLHARVAELAVPGVECFGVGAIAELGFEGRSWIIAPDGRGGVDVLAQAPDAVGESIVTATVALPAR